MHQTIESRQSVKYALTSLARDVAFVKNKLGLILFLLSYIVTFETLPERLFRTSKTFSNIYRRFWN